MFTCRLALALGKSLSEIASVPTSEMITWMAFDQLYPVGGVGDDQRMNALMQLTYLINAERGAKAPNFFERWKVGEGDKPTPKQVDAKIMAFYKAQKAMAGKRNRKLGRTKASNAGQPEHQ